MQPQVQRLYRMWQSNDIPVIFYHASGVQTSLPGCHHALLLHICPVNTHKSSVVQASLHHNNSWTLLRACKEVPWIVRMKKLEVSHFLPTDVFPSGPQPVWSVITTDIHVTQVVGWRGIWRNMPQGKVYKTTTIMLITVTCWTTNIFYHRQWLLPPYFPQYTSLALTFMIYIFVVYTPNPSVPITTVLHSLAPTLFLYEKCLSFPSTYA